jgi:inhibitor of KinA sporulation pathway (predicted exonuclease)
MSLTDFDANDSIRASSAECLPGLVRVVKKVHGINANLHNMGRTFTANLHKAMQKETETDSLIAQVNAFKDIIDECG